MSGKKKTDENGIKLDARSLEKRLSNVRDSAEDIQKVSKWCLQNRTQYHSIVHAWLKVIKKAKASHRLTLFYVCNDIVQNARRKKFMTIVQHFFTAIKEAAPLVREERIRGKIIRIFKIWEERGVYDSKLIAELTDIVKNAETLANSESENVLPAFQLPQLMEGLRSVVALEQTAESLLGDLKSQDFNLTDKELDSLSESIKERRPSVEKITEFDEAMTSLECYSTTLKKQIDERSKMVSLLEQAQIYYNTQRGEAKVVANAYKSFASCIKTVRNKLNDKIKILPRRDDDSPLLEPPSPSTVPSPIPSPEALSPVPSDSEDCSVIASKDGSGNMDSFLNTSYSSFSSHPTDLDSRLASLGATAILPNLDTSSGSANLSSSNMEDVHTVYDTSPPPTNPSPDPNESDLYDPNTAYRITKPPSTPQKAPAVPRSVSQPEDERGSKTSNDENLSAPARRSSSSASMSSYPSSGYHSSSHTKTEGSSSTIEAVAPSAEQILSKSKDYFDELSVISSDRDYRRSRTYSSSSSSKEYSRDKSSKEYSSNSREIDNKEYSSSTSSSSKDPSKEYSSSSRDYKDYGSSSSSRNYSSKDHGSRSEHSGSSNYKQEYSSSGSRDGSSGTSSRDYLTSRGEYSSSSSRSDSHSRDHASSSGSRSNYSSSRGDYASSRSEHSSTRGDYSSSHSSSRDHSGRDYKSSSSTSRGSELEQSSGHRDSSAHKEGSGGGYRETSGHRDSSSSHRESGSYKTTSRTNSIDMESSVKEGSHKEGSSSYRESNGGHRDGSSRSSKEKSGSSRSSKEKERSSSYSKDLLSNEFKPMNAAELLDAFSKELVAKSRSCDSSNKGTPASSNGSPTPSSSSIAASTKAALPPPSIVPMPVLPPVCPPPTFSNIPIPPTPPPTSVRPPLPPLPPPLPPSTVTMGAFPPPALNTFLPAPLPPCPPPPPSSSNPPPPLPPPAAGPPHHNLPPAQPPPSSFTSFAPKSWDCATPRLPPLPPPPPPPPQLSDYNAAEDQREGGDGGGSAYWQPDYYDYDDSTDNINWMEPPGNEELAAIARDSEKTPDRNGSSSPKSTQDSQMKDLNSLLGKVKQLVTNTKNKSGDAHSSNYLRIIPTMQDAPGREDSPADKEFKCYDYRSLSDHVSPKRKAKSDGNSKSGTGKHGNNSGSDMDISGSDEDDVTLTPDTNVYDADSPRKRTADENGTENQPPNKKDKPDISDDSSNDSFSSTVSMTSNSNVAAGSEASKETAPIQSLGHTSSTPQPIESRCYDADGGNQSELQDKSEDIYGDIDGAVEPAPLHSNINLSSGDFSNITNAIKILISGERRKSELPDPKGFEGGGSNSSSSTPKLNLGGSKEADLGAGVDGTNDVENNYNISPDFGTPPPRQSAIERLGSPPRKQESMPLSVIGGTPSGMVGSPQLRHSFSGPLLRSPFGDSPRGGGFGTPQRGASTPIMHDSFRPRNPSLMHSPMRFHMNPFDGSPQQFRPPHEGGRGGPPFRGRGSPNVSRGGRGNFRGSPFRGGGGGGGPRQMFQQNRGRGRW